MNRPVKPLRSEADHDAALVEIQAVWGAAPETPAGDRLNVHVALVEAYERQQPAIAAADRVALIRFQMTQRGLDTGDLVPAIGPLSRVSEILNRRRPLTLEMIRKLQDLLDIPASALVHPYPLVPCAVVTRAAAQDCLTEFTVEKPSRAFPVSPLASHHSTKIKSSDLLSGPDQDR